VCTLLFLHPIPSVEDLARIYQRGYYDSWGGEEVAELVACQKKAYFAQHFRTITALRPGGIILDLGCAKGAFVELALQKGYSAFGVEISEYAGSIARTRVGEDRISIGRLEDASFAPESFDVVTMFDFLEHLNDPGKLMRSVAGLLRRDGLVYVVTPDTDSLSFTLMGKHWWHFKEEHLCYYNAKSVKALLERAGLYLTSRSACRKRLTLEYFISQMRAYPVPVLASLAGALGKILPEGMRNLACTLPSGEMQVMARKV